MPVLPLKYEDPKTASISMCTDPSDPTPPGSPSIWEQHKGNEIMRITINGDLMADAKYVNDVNKVGQFASRWLEMKKLRAITHAHL
ncbi:hypothetical protein GE061_009515 [Apolygus lucorum]|uniref:Uncharacterized protein n=1 Tax=Apolygus lucorum TaxID=248454 RepID=A0A8S9Y0F7_APOLU|nr:hypothetical protein GE061_009515 [Apolygus lucorum]